MLCLDARFCFFLIYMNFYIGICFLFYTIFTTFLCIILLYFHLILTLFLLILLILLFSKLAIHIKDLLIWHLINRLCHLWMKLIQDCSNLHYKGFLIFNILIYGIKIYLWGFLLNLRRRIWHWYLHIYWLLNIFQFWNLKIILCLVLIISLRAFSIIWINDRYLFFDII